MLNSSNRSVCAVEQLTATLDICLQHWGRYSYPHYAALQPVVDLKLQIIEKRARDEVRRKKLPGRISNQDRQYAAWSVLKDAIDSLCPRPAQLSPVYRRALEKIPETGWSAQLIVPQELYFYLFLYLAYVTKTYNNARLALLFQVAPRTLADIRSEAIKTVSARIFALEERCSRSHQETRQNR